MTDYTAPMTWVNQQLVLASQLKREIVDNPLWLKTRPLANLASTGTINTTSTSFIEVVESRIDLTTFGGNVLLATCGACATTTTGQNVTVDFACDGVRYGDATVGLTQITNPNVGYLDSLSIVLFSSTPPSVGAHVFSIWWKVGGGTGQLFTRFFALEIR